MKCLFKIGDHHVKAKRMMWEELSDFSLVSNITCIYIIYYMGERESPI